MAGIRVRLLAPTDKGRLYPRYDTAVDILNLKSSVRRPWPRGVNTEDVTMDADEDRILANVEVRVSVHHWTVVQPFPFDRPAYRAADIEVSETTVGEREFNLPLVVQTDRNRSRVLILLDSTREVRKVIELSMNCSALIVDNDLIGFYAKLDRPLLPTS